MGFWAWFWIWTGLVIGSFGIFGLIGLSLFNRALEVGHQISRISKPLGILISAFETKPTLEDKESDVLRSSTEVDAERQTFLKKKSKKRAARQRSLRTALKNIDVNESRFTNV